MITGNAYIAIVVVVAAVLIVGALISHRHDCD